MNSLEGLVLSPKSAKDCWRFHVFVLCFFFFTFSKSSFAEQQAPVSEIWGHGFKTVFPKQFFVLFSTLNSRISRNMSYLRHKVRNGKKIPPWSPNYTSYIVLSNLIDNLGNIFTNLRQHYFTKFTFSFVLWAPKCLETCLNRITICVLPKIGWHSDLHGKMNTNINFPSHPGKQGRMVPLIRPFICRVPPCPAQSLLMGLRTVSATLWLNHSDPSRL